MSKRSKLLLEMASRRRSLVNGLRQGRESALEDRQREADDRLQTTVREGKGDEHRTTLLPEAPVEPLKRHLAHVRQEHERALREGYAGVELPYALTRKYPSADKTWAWQPARLAGVRHVVNPAK